MTPVDDGRARRTGPKPRPARGRPSRCCAGVAILLVTAIMVWVLAPDDSSPPSPTTPTSSRARRPPGASTDTTGTTTTPATTAGTSRRRRAGRRPARAGEPTAPTFAADRGVSARPLPGRARSTRSTPADSVLVAAPTGSGKTLVAEYAIERGARRRREGLLHDAAEGALEPEVRRPRPRATAASGSVSSPGDNSVNGEAPIVVMTTEVLRNMIYAASPDARRAALRRARRGALPPGPLPRRGLGGGDRPPRARGRPRVPLGDGVERRGGRGLDRDGPRRDDRGHRGAPPGRAAQPATWSGSAATGALHLLPTFVGHGETIRPNPEVERLERPRRRSGAADRGGTGGSAQRLRASCARRAGSRSSSCSRTEQHAPGDRVRVQPRRLRPGGRPVPRRPGSGSRPPTSAPRSGASPSIAHRRARRRRARRPAVRRVARRARGRVRRPPRRARPADEGGGRGGVRRRAGEGRLRDRDARARDQHAGALRRHREAHEVHRGAPRVPDAGRVHPAHRARRAARHRRRSGTRSCCWSPFVRFEQVAGSRPGAPTRSTLVVPPDVQHGGQPRPPVLGAPTAHHLLNLSFAQFHADRDVVALERELDRTQDLLRRQREAARERLRRHRGVPRARVRRSRRRGATGAPDVASPGRSTSLRPGDVLVVGRRGGRVVVLAQESRRNGPPRVLALNESRTLVRLGTDDFDAPPEAGRRTSTLPEPYAPRSPAFRRTRSRVAAARSGCAAPGAAPVAADDVARARGGGRPGIRSPRTPSATRTFARPPPSNGSNARPARLERRVRGRSESLARQFDRVLARARELGLRRRLGAHRPAVRCWRGIYTESRPAARGVDPRGPARRSRRRRSSPRSPRASPTSAAAPTATRPRHRRAGRARASRSAPGPSNGSGAPSRPPRRTAGCPRPVRPTRASPCTSPSGRGATTSPTCSPTTSSPAATSCATSSSASTCCARSPTSHPTRRPGDWPTRAADACVRGVVAAASALAT